MTEQQLCAGCLQPIAEPDMIEAVELEAQYRDEYGDDATRDDVQRVMVCTQCLARLQRIKHNESIDK